MTKRLPYRERLMQALTDPMEVTAYLNAAREDSQQAFVNALKNVAQARHTRREGKPPSPCITGTES